MYMECCQTGGPLTTIWQRPAHRFKHIFLIKLAPSFRKHLRPHWSGLEVLSASCLSSTEFVHQFPVHDSSGKDRNRNSSKRAALCEGGSFGANSVGWMRSRWAMSVLFYPLRLSGTFKLVPGPAVVSQQSPISTITRSTKG